MTDKRHTPSRNFESFSEAMLAISSSQMQQEMFYARNQYLDIPKELPKMADNVKSSKLSKLNTVFTPSTAITMANLFAGRAKQLDKIWDAICEKGQHIVLYGERGVGKTSLSNIVDLILKSNYESDVICARISCSPMQSFEDIWRDIFKKIQITLSTPGIGFTASAKAQLTNLDQYFLLGLSKKLNLMMCLIFSNNFRKLSF